MCRTCGQHEYSLRVTTCTTPSFCTAVSLNFNDLSISTFCTQLYTRIYTLVVNNKNSLILSVNRQLSTVSTVLITKATKDKFKFVYNN